MEGEPVPTAPDAPPGTHLGVTPHPLWFGAILSFGALLGVLDGQWGLATLFLVFSGGFFVAALIGWWRGRRPVGIQQ